MHMQRTRCLTRARACRMSVPMVMAPCGVLVDLVSERHLMTMDVEDMDTWAPPPPRASAAGRPGAHARGRVPRILHPAQQAARAAPAALPCQLSCGSRVAFAKAALRATNR